MASGASNEASAAAEPPPDPPGMRVRSHGLCVGPYAEFSVEEPMANSSMFVLPKITTPDCLSFATTVESYGGRQPSNIFEPHVVGTPFCAKTSLRASGTPAKAESFSPLLRFASTSRACARAFSLSTCKKACTFESTFSIWTKCASVSSTDVIEPALRASDICAAVE